MQALKFTFQRKLTKTLAWKLQRAVAFRCNQWKHWSIVAILVQIVTNNEEKISLLTHFMQSWSWCNWACPRENFQPSTLDCTHIYFIDFNIPFESLSIYDVNLNVRLRIFNPLELLHVNLLSRIIETDKEFAATYFKGQSMTKIHTKI